MWQLQLWTKLIVELKVNQQPAHSTLKRSSNQRSTRFLTWIPAFAFSGRLARMSRSWNVDSRVRPSKQALTWLRRIQNFVVARPVLWREAELLTVDVQGTMFTCQPLCGVLRSPSIRLRFWWYLHLAVALHFKPPTSSTALPAKPFPW